MITKEKQSGRNWSSARAHGVAPAVDGERDASAEGGALGGEEQHRLGDLFRLADAAHCVRRRAPLEELYGRQWS